MTRTPVRLLSAGLAVLFMAACAQSNGDINRVQPNYTRKADLLDGVWYFRNTVTGASANTGFTFTGETGNLEKVVFEITEENVTAYRAYPYIVGTDRESIEETSKPTGTTTRFCKAGKCTGGHPYYGAPIAQYSIRSHFDIQRTYNSATGETSNVIVENTSDRPWNEREFVRIDWNQSLANKGDSMMWNSVQNPAGGSDFNAWIQPNEPGTDPYDWPVREYTRDAEGEDRLTYMDFTGRYYAKPFEDYIPGYEEFGKFPVCYIRWQFYPSNYKYDCTSQEIRMRTSLAKVDPVKTNDYQPLVYGNELMQKFGYFRTERFTYDRGFGTTERGRIFLANRFNIWKETFRKDAQGNPDKSQVIPFAERSPKPIVYYVSPAARMGGEAVYKQYLAAARGYEWEKVDPVRADSPYAWKKAKDFYGSDLRGLEDGWDHAFRRAVAAAQGKATHDEKMLYICENPVPETDTLTGEPLSEDYRLHCGQPGFSPKFGDLRYSFLYTITEPTPNGLLGYGPSSADPETGELISANANTYTGAVDTQAQYAVDVIDLLTGNRSIDEHVKGDDVRRYFLNNPAYANPLKNTSGAIRAELGSVEDKNQKMEPAYADPAPRLAGLISRLSVSGVPEFKTDALRSAAGKLAQRPDLEALIIDNPEISRDVVSLLPAPIAAAAMEDPSLLRQAARKLLLNVDDVHKYEQARIDWASRKNIYLAEFMDRPMFTLAFKEGNLRMGRVGDLLIQGMSELQANQIADQELRERLQRRVWRSTSEHEIGHTFGLRHNFQASFDALNYFDPYWDMKQETLTVCATGTAVAGQTSTCTLPGNVQGRKIYPGTPADLKAASDGTMEQLEQGMHDHEYSSIMDYGGKANADFQGVGKYDEAAILFAYSGGSEPGYVEVFDSARATPLDVKTSSGSTLTVPGAGYAMPVIAAQRTNTAVPNYTERYHYSLLPLHFADVANTNNLDNAIVDGISRMRSRSLMKWSDVKSAHDELRRIIKNNPEPSPSDVTAPLEVPYMFCTDDHVGSILSCNRFDRGADYYEMTRTTLEDYWNGYFFTHFKRDRYNFNDDRAFRNAYSTFYDTSNVYKHWVYAVYQQSGGDAQNLSNFRSGPFSYDPLMFATWTMGVFDGFNNVLRVSQVPPAGYYARVVTDTNLDGTIDELDVTPDGTDFHRAWSNITEGDEFDNLTAEGIEAARSLYEDNYRSPNVDLSVPYADAFGLLPRGDARRVYSRYDFKSGFGFQNRMVEVGHYNDQMGAMFASINSYAEFLGVDDIADQRRFNIPYYLVFKREMSDVFGGMWAQDENKVRPVAHLELDPVSGQPVSPQRLKIDFLEKAQASDFFEGFVYPQESQAISAYPAAARAAPANITLTYTSRFYGLYLGIATFNINFDADYAKSVQVFKLGSGEEFEVAPGYTAFEVQDITTGAVYAAVQPSSYTQEQDTPAVRMIKEALKYKRIMDDPSLVLSEIERTNPQVVEETREVYRDAFHGQVEDLDVMRGFYSIFGSVL